MKSEGLNVAPHLSFGGDDEESMLALLTQYKEAGIDRIVALRGDMPSGVGGALQLVYANELVAFIRKHFGAHFQLEVAAYPEIHPESESYSSDINYLKQKLDAGANSAITQYFFNPDAYFYFIEQCDKAIELISELCETLLDNGAPGLHFYTMNQIEPTRQILLNLGLNPGTEAH